MPGRKKKIFTDGVYHVFNKSINSTAIFDSDYNCSLFLNIIRYYRSGKARVSFSHLKYISSELRQHILLQTQIEEHFRVKLLAYCLMPTHYHLLLAQLEDNGVSKFISNVTNSFTRHLNVKNERLGPLFLTKFKAVPILTDEQLIHISRYIHLNPYSSNIVRDIEELEIYPWSSYRQYISGIQGLCVTKPVMKLFNHKLQRYKNFITQRADYQKTLEFAKHAEKWI